MPSLEYHLILMSLALVLCTAVAFQLGRVSADRKNRRENAATADCATCGWSSGPVPLSGAFGAAHEHTGLDTISTRPHRVMVVKA